MATDSLSPFKSRHAGVEVTPSSARKRSVTEHSTNKIIDVPWKPNAAWEGGGSNQGTLTSKTLTVLAMAGGAFWTLFPDNSMTLYTQGCPKHSTQETERSSHPISTTIPAVFITSKMKIHLLPKGLSAIKRLEYFYMNDHSHNWKAHGPKGTRVLRVPHCHIQVTQHLSALLPWRPRREAEGNLPRDIPATDPATPGNIC